MLARLRSKRLLWPAVMTLAAFAVLVALGNWQLARKQWKEDLIRRIEVRTAAAPVTLEEAMRRVESGADAEYTRVAVNGRFLSDRELYLYAPDPQRGAGVHVYVPLETAPGGLTVLVNRGFVPEALKNQTNKPSGAIDVVGLLRLPEKPGLFTPTNDSKGNFWYWRDLDAMSKAALGDRTGHVRLAPFFLDAEKNAADPEAWPQGGVTRLVIPNRHLEYALTWFGLAATLLIVFGFYAASRLRPPPEP